MSLSPVTLDEFRDSLNLTENDGHTSDEELWNAVLSAVDLVENECGPIRLREQTSRVRPAGCTLFLPVFPVVSVTTVTDSLLATVSEDRYEVNTDTGVIDGLSPLTSRWYEVTYTVGREPIPRALMDAVLILAKLEWGTQRGPKQVNRFTGIGDIEAAGNVSSGGLDKYRADSLMAPFRQLHVA
jgi:hypothetical protein